MALINMKIETVRTLSPVIRTTLYTMHNHDPAISTQRHEEVKERTQKKKKGKRTRVTANCPISTQVN